jgi:hypothetical protein
MQIGGQHLDSAVYRVSATFVTIEVCRNRSHCALAGGASKMSKIVNLSKFRKQKAKEARVKQADTNRSLDP